MLFNKIKRYLSDNNIDINNVSDEFEILDMSDSKGPFINKWNVQGLIKPTQEQLDAISDNDILLEEAQEAKKTEIKTQRDNNFTKPLLVRSNPDIYLKPQPQVNIFLAAYSMADGSTKEWFPCDINGVKLTESIDITKDELIIVANHYEERKTLEYNQCNKRCFAVDALTTIEEVENFDINQVIV